jgi:hypothetical protein
VPVFHEESEVVPLLSQMRLPRWIVLELITSIAGERANVSPLDAPQVMGFETWRWGTRFAREHEELKKLGWEVCEKNQISGIRNAAVKIKLVVCATNNNTGNLRRSPRNFTERSPGARKLIHKNSAQYAMEFLTKPDEDELWYICHHYNEKYITAEISRPDGEESGFITSYSHRIIIAKPNEIPGVRRFKVPEEFAEVPKPTATRKRG